MCVVLTVNQGSASATLLQSLGRCMRHSLMFQALSNYYIQKCRFPSHSFSFRSKIALEASQALYLLISGKNMSCLSASMGEVYSQFRDPDGFLYITYASQDLFG